MIRQPTRLSGVRTNFVNPLNIMFRSVPTLVPFGSRESLPGQTRRSVVPLSSSASPLPPNIHLPGEDGGSVQPISVSSTWGGDRKSPERRRSRRILLQSFRFFVCRISWVSELLSYFFRLVLDSGSGSTHSSTSFRSRGPVNSSSNL